MRCADRKPASLRSFQQAGVTRPFSDDLPASNAQPVLHPGLVVRSNNPLAIAAFLEASEIPRSLIGQSENMGENRGGGRSN